MGKMCGKPFQPTEDKAKTEPLELILSDVIRRLQTATIRGYQNNIMCTDDNTSYIEVYIMKAKSEAAAKFKEYMANVEKEHQNLKLCGI
jgi:hypothetical protein